MPIGLIHQVKILGNDFFVAVPKVITCQVQTFHKLLEPCEVPLHPMPRLSSARPHPSLCPLSQPCRTEVLLPMYACFSSWDTCYGRNLPCEGYFLFVQVFLCVTPRLFSSSTSKPNKLSSIPRTHMAEAESQVLQVVLRLPHGYMSTHETNP